VHAREVWWTCFSRKFTEWQHFESGSKSMHQEWINWMVNMGCSVVELILVACKYQIASCRFKGHRSWKIISDAFSTKTAKSDRFNQIATDLVKSEQIYLNRNVSMDINRGEACGPWRPVVYFAIKPDNYCDVLKTLAFWKQGVLKSAVLFCYRIGLCRLVDDACQ